MYRCNECGNIFEEGEQVKISAVYQSSGCPVCEGSYYEFEPCEICGSCEIEEGEKLCKGCKEKIIKKFKAYLDDFDDIEKEVLREADAGDWI